MSFANSDLDAPTADAIAEAAAEQVVTEHFARIMDSVAGMGIGDGTARGCRWLRAGLIDTAHNHEVDPVKFAEAVVYYADRAGHLHVADKVRTTLATM